MQRRLTFWAVVTVDDELLDAGDRVQSMLQSMPEGFYMSSYVDRELVGENRLTLNVSLGMETIYFDGLDAEHLVSCLRAEVDRLERALSEARPPKKRNARRAIAAA